MTRPRSKSLPTPLGSCFTGKFPVKRERRYGDLTGRPPKPAPVPSPKPTRIALNYRRASAAYDNYERAARLAAQEERIAAEVYWAAVEGESPAATWRSTRWS